MSKPAVSVIVPTYDRLAFLKQALDSIAAQTFRDYEVIVVDDGSNEDIAAGVADHVVRPKVIRQRQQGPAAARNRGIAEASADVLAFLDSDDLWLPTKLERFMEALAQQPEMSIFYGPMSPTDTSGCGVRGRTKPCHSGWICDQLFHCSFVHVPTVVCRRSILQEVGGFDANLPVCEDYDLWLRVSTKYQFGLIAEPLALRRLHDDRLSKCSMSRNLAIKAQVLQRFYAAHAADGKLEPRAAMRRLARVCFVAGREAFREKHYEEAVELCQASRAYGQSMLRSLPFIVISKMLMSRTAKDERAAEPTGVAAKRRCRRIWRS